MIYKIIDKFNKVLKNKELKRKIVIYSRNRIGPKFNDRP